MIELNTALKLKEKNEIINNTNTIIDLFVSELNSKYGNWNRELIYPLVSIPYYSVIDFFLIKFDILKELIEMELKDAELKNDGIEFFGIKWLLNEYKIATKKNLYSNIEIRPLFYFDVLKMVNRKMNNEEKEKIEDIINKLIKLMKRYKYIINNS